MQSLDEQRLETPNTFARYVQSITFTKRILKNTTRLMNRFIKGFLKHRGVIVVKMARQVVRRGVGVKRRVAKIQIHQETLGRTIATGQPGDARLDFKRVQGKSKY
jgi:hypothetical protein